MQGKQAEAILSDLVMKCEEAGLTLPADPWDALAEVVDALRSVNHHEMGRKQMEEALKILTSKFGETPTPAKGKRKAAAKRTGKSSEDATGVISPKAKRGKKAKASAPTTSPLGPTESEEPKESIEEEVEAEPAVRKENQALVDQFMELGKFEIKKGFVKRGRARMRAAKGLHDADKVIKSGAEARKLNGVGAITASMVDKILNEGLQAALRECEENA